MKCAQSPTSVAVDLGPCPVDCGGRLRPKLSPDGTAWEAEACDACERSWWFQVPRPAAAVYQIAGGQGRSAEEVRAAAFAFGEAVASVLALVAVAAILALRGCAS